MAGAVVYLDHDGECGVRRALVAPEDVAAAEADAGDHADDDADVGAGDAADDGGGSLPHSLVQSLTTHRTAALAVTLSQ